MLQAQCIAGDCENGTGTFQFAEGEKYEGEWKNGIRIKGKYYYKSGNIYDGSFSQDIYSNTKPHGFGIKTYSSGAKYEGLWEYGKRTNGTYYYTSGNIYKGDHAKNDEGTYTPHGYGIMTYSNGTKYEGEWLMGERTKGKFYYLSGNVYEGEHAIDKEGNTNPHGYGIMYYISGARYEGTWEYNKRTNGTFYYTDGRIYKGEHAINPEGIYTTNGYGIMKYANGNVYDGQWKMGKYYGKGKLYYNGQLIKSGLWENGIFIQESNTGKDLSEVNIYAVIVGVGRYTAVQSLKYTDDDAYKLAMFFSSPEGGALADDQLKVLIDEDATKENILKVMNSIFGRAEKKDVIIFYFSGHGMEGAFLPYDYDGITNYLFHKEVSEIFQKSKAKNKICIADACHSGSLERNVRSSDIDNTLNSFYDAWKNSEGGTALFMSSKAEESSIEFEGLRQGVFSYHLIQGLKGKADSDEDYIITIQELYNYVSKSVKDYTQSYQNPVIRGDYDENMPIGIIRKE